MGLPGYIVTIGDRPAQSVTAGDTSNAFMVGFSEKGSTQQAIPVYSPADAKAKLGERLSAEPLGYDSIDAFFGEGGTVLYFSRIDPGAVTASKVAEDSESKKTLKFSAVSPGSWGNNIKVAFTTSSEKTAIVVKYNGTVVESSPTLESLAEILAWVAESSYVVVADETESSKMPKTSEITLASGTYSPSSATAEQVEAAITRIDKDLGPGQIFAPGQTSEAIQKALLAHAAANNRRAITDAASGSTAAQIAEAATKLRGTNARFACMVAPWAVIPGVALGTTRTIPYSAIYAGQISRTEAEGFTPNKAAAGKKRGRAKYATNLQSAFTATELETLNNTGVIVAKKVRGVPTTYGFRSLVNPVTDPNWINFPASRLVMGIAAKAGEVMENYEFEEIDGHGYIFGDLKGELSNVACRPYFDKNSLYGQLPEEAFKVETGPDVNTEETIAAGQIKAQIAVRVSPGGEELSVEIVKVPITESL